MPLISVIIYLFYLENQINAEGKLEVCELVITIE